MIPEAQVQNWSNHGFLICGGNMIINPIDKITFGPRGPGNPASPESPRSPCLSTQTWHNGSKQLRKRLENTEFC